MGIAKSRNGLAPVFLIGKAPYLLARYSFTPANKARAAPARDDFLSKILELRHGLGYNHREHKEFTKDTEDVLRKLSSSIRESRV